MVVARFYYPVTILGVIDRCSRCIDAETTTSRATDEDTAVADSTLRIDTDFVVLSPDKQASVESADAALYQRLQQRYNNFSGHELVSSYQFSADWPNWELHPNGDEIIILLSGQTELILQTEEGDISLKLSRQGEYVLVPRNVWHRAKTAHLCTLLFITPGEGTQHRPV
jgi:quercetin dioxygenase-like cupin family protein